MDLDQQTAANKIQTKKSYIWKVYLILLLIVFCAGVYGYYWIESAKKERLEAQNLIAKVGQYEILHVSVQNEVERCKNFIVQEQGNFGGFEYCKKFIEWAKASGEN